MTKEEAINILATYKNTKRKSKLLLDKIIEIKNDLYNAQAGFIELEAGVRVSGGKHQSREEKHATLADLVNEYDKRYEYNEIVCFNTRMLIEEIYTTRDKSNMTVASTIKIERYEIVLIAYYINAKTVEQIATEEGYSYRQTRRILNAAREEFYQVQKSKSKEQISNYIQQALQTKLAAAAAVV